MKKLAIFILSLFILVGLAGFWYWQRNSYSKEVLKLEIIGLSEVQAGQEFEYLVKFKNNGKIRLENPELIFQSPEKSILDGKGDLRITQKIEDIYPGEERTYSFRARLFGRENENLEAKAWLSYQPKNLKARFESKTTLTTAVKFVPITLEFDLPSRIGGEEEISFSLNYFSNIDYLLENLRIKAEYPEGFIFEDSRPEALDEIEWSIKSLARASGGRVEIKGKLGGKEGDEKIFKAQIGILKDSEFWPLKEVKQPVKIAGSPLHLSCLVNGSQNYSASSGELLHYELFFKNIGEGPVQKKFLFARLEGEFFDLTDLKSDNGEIASGDNTILWDWKNISDLRFLDVGQEGKVDFWARLKDGADFKSDNPKIRVEVNFGGVGKTFESKISSKTEIGQKIYYEKDSFESFGPFPPKVGEKTRLIVVWQIKNFWNDLKSAKAKAVLGSGFKPTGEFLPGNAKFTYDSGSGEIIWNIGDMEKWAYSELAFQVEFSPNLSQKGNCVGVSREVEFLAEDSWTSQFLDERANGKNTCEVEGKNQSDGKVQ